MEQVWSTGSFNWFVVEREVAMSARSRCRDLIVCGNCREAGLARLESNVC